VNRLEYSLSWNLFSDSTNVQSSGYRSIWKFNSFEMLGRFVNYFFSFLLAHQRGNELTRGSAKTAGQPVVFKVIFICLRETIKWCCCFRSLSTQLAHRLVWLQSRPGVAMKQLSQGNVVMIETAWTGFNLIRSAEVTWSSHCYRWSHS
jgi:hypothetical protein